MLMLGVLVGVVAVPTLAAASDYRVQAIDLPRHAPYAGGTIAKVHVNTFGAMTVTFGDAQCLCHAALVQNGHWTLLDVPGAAQTVASNPSLWGQVALSYTTDATGLTPWHGDLYALGRYTTVPDVPDFSLQWLEGLNDFGVFVGSTGTRPHVGLLGTRYSQTPFRYPDVPGVCCTRPRQINDAGVIVGTCGVAGRQAFRYDSRTGTGTGLLDPWGATMVQGVGINNLGDTVGLTCWGPDPQQSGAIVMLHGGGYAALPTTAMPDPAAYCVDADGINDLGQVFGQYIASDGVHHGFLATPVQGRR